MPVRVRPRAPNQSVRTQYPISVDFPATRAGVVSDAGVLLVQLGADAIAAPSIDLRSTHGRNGGAAGLSKRAVLAEIGGVERRGQGAPQQPKQSWPVRVREREKRKRHSRSL
jgi:hypothetical protein